MHKFVLLFCTRHSSSSLVVKITNFLSSTRSKFCQSSRSIISCQSTRTITTATMGDMEVDGAAAEEIVANQNAQNVGSSAKEGKVTIITDPNKKIFYNPIQEVNRDISILGIQSFIQREAKKDQNVSILEAMAASGIRSIRYAKEIDGVSSILANDFSPQAVETLKENCKLNDTEKVIPNCEDASLLMLSRKNKFFVVDLDPYGSPIPFLDSAIQCVEDGGMLLVTATDMAVLAGSNTPETCFSKYGSMPIKTKACQELALRIVIHAVQSFANRYGKYVEPILSLKIDFYVRIFFRVLNSPLRCKQRVMQTSMIYQCTGCHSFNFQPLAAKKGGQHFGSAKGPTVGTHCEFCESSFHIGGPVWTGPLHNKDFVSRMEDNVNSDAFEYLGTRRRIQGLLQLVQEELDTPLMYNTGQLSSVLRCSSMKLRSFRSAFLHLGYKISSSHTDADTFKTDAPNEIIWEIFREWHRLGNGGKLKEDAPGFKLLKNLDKKEAHPVINFVDVHKDADPVSRQIGSLRFQMNPTKHWGPASRDGFDTNKIILQQEEAKTKDADAADCPVKTKKRKYRKNSKTEADSDTNISNCKDKDEDNTESTKNTTT